MATDQPPRAGMGRIRGLVEPQRARAHAGKLAAAEYFIALIPVHRWMRLIYSLPEGHACRSAPQRARESLIFLRPSSSV